MPSGFYGTYVVVRSGSPCIAAAPARCFAGLFLFAQPTRPFSQPARRIQGFVVHAGGVSRFLGQGFGVDAPSLSRLRRKGLLDETVNYIRHPDTATLVTRSTSSLSLAELSCEVLSGNVEVSRLSHSWHKLCTPSRTTTWQCMARPLCWHLKVTSKLGFLCVVGPQWVSCRTSSERLRPC